MQIYFGKKEHSLNNITMERKDLDRVSIIKLLGVIIYKKLTWLDHVAYITTKASKRLYLLCLLLRAGVSRKEVLQVYCSIVRSTLEYASEVSHSGLTKEQ